jgi:hypothetical protein
MPFNDGSAEAALLQQDLQRQADEQRALEEQQALQLAFQEQQRHEAEQQAHAHALANQARAAAAASPASIAPHATLLAPSPTPAVAAAPSPLAALPAQQRAGEPSPTQLLEVLSQIRLKQRDKLEEIRLIQRRIAAAPTPEYLQLLVAQQNEVRSKCITASFSLLTFLFSVSFVIVSSKNYPHSIVCCRRCFCATRI